MIERILRLELLSYWHAGSGRGADALADAVVVRDASALPYLPGRTLKGLVRDALELAESVGAIAHGATEGWLGSGPMTAEDGGEDADPEGRMEASRYTRTPGCLWFGSAQLPLAWREWARRPDESGIVEELFTHVACTAVGADGVASEGTLRVYEVAVPMTLRAPIRGPDDATWCKDIETALPLLRCLGTRRQRGYGRVHVVMEEP